MTDTERKRYAIRLEPKDPEGMPLALMGDIWSAIEEAASRNAYRAFMRSDVGLGVVWFEEED